MRRFADAQKPLLKLTSRGITVFLTSTSGDHERLCTDIAITRRDGSSRRGRSQSCAERVPVGGDEHGEHGSPMPPKTISSTWSAARARQRRRAAVADLSRQRAGRKRRKVWALGVCFMMIPLRRTRGDRAGKELLPAIVENA